MMTGTKQDSTIYGGIEAGGTKWVCVIGRGPDDIIAETRFPTTTPTETLARVIAFFQDHQHLGPLAAIGVGTFGPVDLDLRSATYGYIVPPALGNCAGILGVIALSQLMEPEAMGTS